MLAPQKVTKEEGTQPSRPYGSLALLATAATLNIATRVSLRRNRLLRSLSYQQNKPVTKLALAACKLRKLPRSSNSRSLLPYFVSATQRDGMGLFSFKQRY